MMRETGMGMGGGGQRGGVSPAQIATMRAQRSSGGSSGRGNEGALIRGRTGGGMGGMPAMGGAGSGQRPSSEQIAAMRARQGDSGDSLVRSPLFDALIRLLQSKA